MTKKTQRNPFDNLKLIFAGKGITYDEIADLIGKEYQSVLNKMNGRTEFTFTEFQMICKKWGLSEEDFC